MPDLNDLNPNGVLRSGWSAAVGDYAIAAGWAVQGSVLVVVDAAGGVFGFEGKSGAIRWSQNSVHAGGALALAVHPDGTSFATAGQDGRVLLFRADDGEVTRTVELGKGWVEKLAWSPDGAWLAASRSRQVHVINAKGDVAWCSGEHASTVSAIAWAGAQELATACYGSVAFWSASSGEPRQKLEWKGSLVSMVLSADGDIVACGSQDNSVHFWRRSSGQDSMMSGYPGKPSALAFDHTGTLLATGGGPSVTVWSFQGDGPEGTHPGIHELHAEPISALAFTRRGLRLASGGRDSGVVVWELGADGDGGAVGTAIAAGSVADLVWRPDGRALAAVDAGGGVTSWRVRD